MLATLQAAALSLETKQRNSLMNFNGLRFLDSQEFREEPETSNARRPSLLREDVLIVSFGVDLDL